MLSDSASQTHAGRLSTIKSIFIVASGNFLEMFDFMAYGYYTAAIAKTYFPSGSEFASLMAALAAFGAGFLMRPVGALLLGAYIDRHGRKAGLLLTLGLMALGTLSIAVLPGYARIGAAAPLIILLARLVQGLSAGVEVGGVSVYLAEIATPGRKGFYSSWQSASQQAAVMFAALLGLAGAAFLTKAELEAWGWRIPFVIGCLLVPFLFLIRRQLEETPAFLAQSKRPGLTEILRSVSANWRIVLLGALMVVMTTVSFYMITAYTPTYASSVLRLSLASTYFVTMMVGLSNFILLPIMGALSDRIGRRPQLIVATALSIVTSYPCMLWLVKIPSMERLLAVELWFSLLYATYNGAMIVYLTEVMPTNVRTSGFSFAYSLATAIFGGFTPLLCTYLIRETGNAAVPGIWMSFAASVGLLSVLAIGRVRLRQPSEE